MDTDAAKERIRETATKAVDAGVAVKDAVEDLNLADLLADLGGAAQETAAALAENVGEGEAVIRAKLEEAETTIREHPLLAVGIAAGVGFMLGLMLSSAGRRSEEPVDED